jgi:cytochrome c peroxidase
MIHWSIVFLLATVVLAITAAGIAIYGVPSVYNESRLSIHNTTADPYYLVRVDIIKIMIDPTWNQEGDTGHLGPSLVRLGWHHCALFDSRTGNYGSFGGSTIRMNPELGHDDNKGLQDVRKRLDPIKAKHPWISFGDLYCYAAVVAIGAMGGPSVPFRGGRRDTEDPSRAPRVVNLPDGSKGPEGNAGVIHQRAVFSRLGLSDEEGIALIVGGHSIGGAHASRSGFQGKWTHDNLKFNNAFAKALLNLKFEKVKSPKGRDQFIDVADKKIFMLPSDMALLGDRNWLTHLVAFDLDQPRFFSAFSRAFEKLMENGRPR